MTFDHEDEAPGEAPAAAPVLTCRARGCSTSTRDGKPFCLDHVERMDYAASVRARWAKAHRVDPRSGATIETDLGLDLHDDVRSMDVDKSDLTTTRRAAGVRGVRRGS